MTKKERDQIISAIVAIHTQAQYFKGMDILCNLAGLPSLRNEFDDRPARTITRRKFNGWIKSIKAKDAKG